MNGQFKHCLVVQCLKVKMHVRLIGYKQEKSIKPINQSPKMLMSSQGQCCLFLGGWEWGQHLMTMISWEFLEWQNKLIIFNLIKESNLESKLFMRKTRYFSIVFCQNLRTSSLCCCCWPEMKTLTYRPSRAHFKA